MATNQDLIAQLHNAIRNFNSTSDDIIKFIVENNHFTILIGQDSEGWTPLQLSIHKCKTLPAEIVQYLFNAYIYSSTDLPLKQYQLLEQKKFEEFQKQINNLGVSLYKPDIHGFTALHYAILYNAPEEIIDELIDHDWDRAENHPNNEDEEELPRDEEEVPREPLIPPLHLAILDPLSSLLCNRSRDNIVKLLISRNVHSNRQQMLSERFSYLGQDVTPIHLAILCNSSLKVIKSLAEADPSTDLLHYRGLGKYTPLQLAILKCKSLPAGVVNYLFRVYVHKSSPIHQYKLLEQKKFQDFEKQIDDMDVDLEQPDSNGFTALHYAILYNAPDSIVDKLIHRHQERAENHPNNEGLFHLPLIPPLHLAILDPICSFSWKRSQSEIVKLLTSKGAHNIEEMLSERCVQIGPNNEYFMGLTPLHLAISCNVSKNVIEALLGKSPSRKLFGLKDFRKYTPLQLAILKCKSLPAGVVNYLCHAYIYSSTDLPLEQYPTDLLLKQYQLLEQKKFKEFQKQIKNLGVSLYKPDTHGFTALHYAILYNSPENIIDELIHAHPERSENLSSNEREHLLVQRDEEEAPTEPLLPPLHLAILDPLSSFSGNRSRGNIERLLVSRYNHNNRKEMLSERCVQIGPNNEDFNDLTPLHLAVSCNVSKNVIETLLDKGRTTAELLELKELMELKDFQNCTPLQLALHKCFFLSEGIIKYLFDVYLDSSPDVPLKQYKLLKEENFKDFELEINGELIRDHLFLADSHGFTALHYAILYKASTRVVKKLLKLLSVYLLRRPIVKSPIRAKHDTPISPLHLAILAPLNLTSTDRSPEYSIELLLDADITATKESLIYDRFFEIGMNNEHHDSLTPLQLAISSKASASVISSLVDADITKKKEAVTGETSRNKIDEYPLLAAIKNHHPKDVIESLVDADKSGDRCTCINAIPHFCLGDLPNEYVSIIIDDRILSHLLYQKDVDHGQEYFPANEEFSYMIPNKYYSDLAIIPAFQHHLSKKWCVTYAFAYLLIFDFYVYLTVLICFMWPWERGDKHWATFLLSILPWLLLAREVVEMNCSGFIRWIKRPHHWLDVLYGILLLICNFGSRNYANQSLSKNERISVLITSGLVWIMPIISLQIMFQSFALFVSGVLNVST
jgi:ankyrin repeat protein